MTPSVGHAQHPFSRARSQGRARQAAVVAERTQRLQSAGFSPPDAYSLAHDASIDVDLIDTLRSCGHCPASALQLARHQAAQRLLERFALLSWARVPLELQARIAADERYDLDQLAQLVSRGCDPTLAVRIIAPEDEPHASESDGDAAAPIVTAAAQSRRTPAAAYAFGEVS